MQRQTAPARRRRRVGGLGLLAALALVLSGCGAEFQRGYLPEPVTEIGPKVINFWNWTWIAALAVGILVWGLIFWCIVAYRRKKDEKGLPTQLRYNVPIEILYTVVPVLMVAVLFGKTVELQHEMVDTSAEADVTVNAIGKKWSWDFNYVEDNAHIIGTQATNLNLGEEGLHDDLPTLVLPVDSRIEFVLTSRDVIHSFWVPQFLTKLDMVPGRVNTFQAVTTEEGTFQGKCAELCGAYHSEMLFQVQVVPQEEYDAFIEDLKATGGEGLVGNEYNLYGLHEGQPAKLPPELLEDYNASQEEEN
ncbi:cytochrome c oxidase subunit II [Ornithinimicrobium faecis]|uniref:Cytochrome c oxidase subunit 2 n=1 Tax=Ornithinimicrobium faecis TaxID=2934158 RepID=A0ABY4YXZ1_9MICO|nr:cytochrome c oxidase subunit II [Ornithinimicrobium sp. HY1793]USQ81653.1 cytochrome c oxidase subunit II [Ornithinimicrobium sp. HY1793]